MNRLVQIVSFAALSGALLAGCAGQASDPSPVVQSYLEALVKSDGETLRSLSCADWEATAVTQADSFSAMDARLEGVSCRQTGTNGNFTLVTCDGKIVTTYNGEDREWALGTYQAVEEGGEWKMCGEAE